MEEEQEAPRKIALKVPSLFIKSASSQPSSEVKPEDPDKKKLARPMPASMRKKLEEAKQKEETASELSQPSSVASELSSRAEESETPPQSKPSRPMPASARRKLETTPENATNDTDTNCSVSSSGNNQEHGGSKQSNRPMPASARKIFEGNIKPSKVADEEAASEGVVNSITDQTAEKTKVTTPSKSKPMPASAKKEIEQGRKQDDKTDEVGSFAVTDKKSSEQIKPASKPMPASAKKKQEATNEETEKMDDDAVSNTSSRTEGSKSVDSEPKRKGKKPMPASARRKLEKVDSDSEENAGTQSKVELSLNMRDDSAEEDTNSVDQTVLIESFSQSGHNEKKEPFIKESDATQEAKKINISLGGIKFPTFNKPMPASVKRKADKSISEEHIGNDSRPSTSHNSEVGQKGKEEGTTMRSSRRNRSSTQELVALQDEKFPCDICDSVFYSLSSRNNHLKIHQEKTKIGEENVERKIKSEKFNPKAKKNVKESKYKGMKNCPHCNRYFSDKKKLKGHAYKCGRSGTPANLACKYCDMKFQYPSQLVKHEKIHTKAENEDKSNIDDDMDQISPNYDNAPSPMSVESKRDDDSKSSPKGSVVEKPRPMPRSMKAKLEKEVDSKGEIAAKIENKPQGLSAGANSFKRKIAEVLSNLGTRYNELQTSRANAEDDGPPRKKKILCKEGSGESISGHPMPASVKKKLEVRDSKIKGVKSNGNKSVPSTPTSSKNLTDVDLLECEVCHRVFTEAFNRKRHEISVHSIENPRGGSATPRSPAASATIIPKPEKIYKEVESKPTTIHLTKTKGGKCPVCAKFILTRLKRHVETVHKLNVTTPSSSPAIPIKFPAKPSAPKSYKIYKSATNKIKQKLASSSSIKNPVISLKNIAPQKGDGDTKTETKVIASTASSDLRCACCDKMFQVNCDFYEHMKMVHPKVKRLVTCKLCDHKFSHEEDFFLHMQFKHKELVESMTPKSDSPAKKGSKQNTVAEVVCTPSETRSTRKSSSKQNAEDDKKISSTVLKEAFVRISRQEKKLAENALKQQHASKKSEEFNFNSSSRVTRKSSTRHPTTKLEPVEVYNDNESGHHFDDSGPMEVEEESEIAITSTFSQRNSTPQKQGNTKADSFDLDAMHCSACSEVFYSYEALRKHELYFHNVKTTKMCPICGVYPTRLSRHLLAHENKTVRCSCVPCRLSFPEFSQLLKHNLENHPGADGGALCAPNKSREEMESGQGGQSSATTDIYRCLLCSKKFIGGGNARRHIRRAHSEQEGDAEDFVEKVDDDEKDDKKDDKEVEDILEDTNKKLMDPDWGDSDNDNVQMETCTTPPQSMISNLRKSGRPMPASARVKLEQQKQDQMSVHSSVSNESTSQSQKRGARPMPASARAKIALLAKNEEQSSTTSTRSTVSDSKPARPMPASVRAKLISQNVTTSENSRDSSADDKVNKPRRPMPASARAKLGIVATIAVHSPSSALGDDDMPSLTPEVILENNHCKVKQTSAQSPEEVVALDDDDDPVDDSFPETEEHFEPAPPSVPTFSIADEIAEHNRAVRLAMGDPNESDFSFSYMFQCKLCNKKFDSAEVTRRHIKKAHSEYGPDHTENLMAQLFDEYADTPRRRNANVRYTEDYMDDIDDEVIIPRGTSRRPKAQFPGSTATPKPAATKKSKILNSDLPLAFACEWCGQRKNSPGNVRRHISRAHPHLAHHREKGVITVESEQNFVIKETPPPPPPPENKANPIYVCKICSRCMTLRHSLYNHISRSHPEVGKGNVSNYIQELNGSSDNAINVASEDNSMEVDNSDNGFYCSICSYQTTDEHDYVQHYKSHTGVSPYQCQYCSATFNQRQQLNDHVTREHTGAEFLTADETEISMEEVVGANQISLATTSKILIEPQKPLSLNRLYSSDGNGHSEVASKKYTPGPASRKTAAARKSVPPPPVNETAADSDSNSPPASPPPPPAHEEDEIENDEEEETEIPQQKKSTVYTYQGDLSSLFPTLGGGPAPGGIDALDDIDGGMSLD